MKRIAVINQKGGVGKTTTTVSLGAALAQKGHKVLLLDLDPQANLTVHVDKRPDLEGNTMTTLLLEDAKIKDLVLETATSGLFVVPSDSSLAGVEQVLANRIGRETILREALEAWEEQDGGSEFDFVLFDCPPSLGVLSANVLVAADRVVIPMQAEFLSLQGMAKLLEVIQLVQKRLNQQLDIACVLPCMVDGRTNLSAEVLREIGEHFGPLLATTRIRNNVKLAEAPSFGRTIFEHAPESNGAADYDEFADEFLRLMGMAPPLPATSSDESDEDEVEVEVDDDAESADESAELEGFVARPGPIIDVPDHEFDATPDEPAPVETAAAETPPDESTTGQSEAGAPVPAAGSPTDAMPEAVGPGTPTREETPAPAEERLAEGATEIEREADA